MVVPKLKNAEDLFGDGTNEYVSASQCLRGHTPMKLLRPQLSLGSRSCLKRDASV